MYLSNTPSKASWRSYLKGIFFSFAFNSGLAQAGHRLRKNDLTVLNYHRIDDIARKDFNTFKPNVSAHPQSFAQQMDYLMRWFNIVSVSDVVGWLDKKKSLPPHAALITFDDGYLDNYKSAYPVLQERRLPAVIFLASGHIQQDVPFYWDLIAYCFKHTCCDHIKSPDGREVHWKNESEAINLSVNLIESLKKIPEEEKEAWVTRIPEMLKVSIPSGYFQSLMVNWEQIREMNRNGIEFGGHTVHHPILTRVSLQRAKEEISNSKLRIEQELGKSIQSFAYPNGGKADFNYEIELLTANAGYRTAFTLLNGPTTQKEARGNPFAIRRIFISHKHTLPQFSALVGWFNRYRSL